LDSYWPTNEQLDLAESELLDSFNVDFALGASLSMDSNFDNLANLDTDTTGKGGLGFTSLDSDMAEVSVSKQASFENEVKRSEVKCVSKRRGSGSGPQ
jgi:hypothetical protein